MAQVQEISASPLGQEENLLTLRDVCTILDGSCIITTPTQHGRVIVRHDGDPITDWYHDVSCFSELRNDLHEFTLTCGLSWEV